MKIVSGLFEGRATGTPLCGLIENTNTRSGDYAQLRARMRPGHADYAGSVKYAGFNDPRGGGHFSGRITAPLVFAGSIARQLLAQRGVTIGAHIAAIESVQDAPFDAVNVDAATLERLQASRFPLLIPSERTPCVRACRGPGLIATASAASSSAPRSACPRHRLAVLRLGGERRQPAALLHPGGPSPSSSATRRWMARMPAANQPTDGPSTGTGCRLPDQPQRRCDRRHHQPHAGGSSALCKPTPSSPPARADPRPVHGENTTLAITAATTGDRSLAPSSSSKARWPSPCAN